MAPKCSGTFQVELDRNGNAVLVLSGSRRRARQQQAQYAHPPDPSTVLEHLENGDWMVNRDRVVVTKKQIQVAIVNIQKRLRMTCVGAFGDWSAEADQELQAWLAKKPKAEAKAHNNLLRDGDAPTAGAGAVLAIEDATAGAGSSSDHLTNMDPCTQSLAGARSR